MQLNNKIRTKAMSDLYEKLNNPQGSLKELVQYVRAYTGINCGGPTSPIWFCSLEPGSGAFSIDKETSKYKIISPEDYSEAKEGYTTNPKLVKCYLDKQTIHDYLRGNFSHNHNAKGRRGGSAFYRSMISILTALKEPQKSSTTLTRPYAAVETYKFFDVNAWGFSFNVSPISVSTRDRAQLEWCSIKNHESVDTFRLLEVPESNEKLTFSEWTGCPNYTDFFSWCAKERHQTFKKLREFYKPKLIYCSGLSSLKSFSDLWFGEMADQQIEKYEKKNFAGSKGRSTELSYTWIENIDHEPTLLVIGPFFGVRYYLSSYQGNVVLARKLQELLDEKAISL